MTTIPEWIIKDLHQSDVSWGSAHKLLPKIIKQFIPLPTSGAEIGVAYGSMACSLLKEIPTLNMLCVDPFIPYDINDQMSMDEGRSEELYQFTKSRLESEHPNRAVLARIKSSDACVMAQDDSFDFVFIDACHQYDDVKNDISIWEKKVKKGGLISGHDYGGLWPSVVRAVNEYAIKNQKPIIHDAESTIWAIIK